MRKFIGEHAETFYKGIFAAYLSKDNKIKVDRAASFITSSGIFTPTHAARADKVVQEPGAPEMK